MTSTVKQERRALRLSIWGALSMAALGFLFAWWTDSEAILLDGVFSLLGFALALATMQVAGMALRPDDEHFPFGYAGFESLLNLAKGLAIGLVSIVALASALESLFRGGRPISAGPAAIYGVLAAAGCFTIWALQRRAARATGSPLVEVDARNWMVDGAISSVVALGFVAAALLESSRFAHWLPYVDPVLVIVVIAATANVPFAIVSQGFRELLLAAPDLDEAETVESRIDRLVDAPGILEHVPRLVRRGRLHYLNLYLVVTDDSPLAEVAGQDAFRARVDEALSPVLPNLVVDLLVTRERRWAYDTGVADGDRRD